MLQSWFDPKKCWYQQKFGGLGKDNNKEDDYIGYPIIVLPLQEIVTDFVPIYAFFPPILWYFVQKAKSAEKCWRKHNLARICLSNIFYE